ncbi:hypothetical protein [Helicobacter sp. MIT 14-3879]|uniref:hypothetical protein n=1 Tax=Helicobacter sp. MIT 14-3879 TaxID=2040649 RepID=UPI0015F16A14|nr:hypothetical protein [Helicobacter sp. MIT 14-3879]
MQRNCEIALTFVRSKVRFLINGISYCSFAADFVNTLANKESVLIAQKKVVSIVGNTAIEQTKDKIVIQVGKVQVIIDDKGLRVKGGDLRAD